MKAKGFLFLAGACGATLVSAAESRFGINISLGAPPPVVVREAPPGPIVVEEHEHRLASPGPGYVWIPRHHAWVNGRWEQVDGTWVMPPQPEARWVEGRWDQQSKTWIADHWEVTRTSAYAEAPNGPPPEPRVEYRERPEYAPPPAPVYVQPNGEPTPGYAGGEAEITLEVAPPPLRRETVSARPSPRHVWVAGYWAADHGRHEWMAGHWELPPEGRAVWVAPRWEQRGRSYVFVRGFWK